MKEQKDCVPFTENDSKAIVSKIGNSKEYKELSDDILVSLDLVLKEKFLYEKLLYKYKNQHRRAIYWHKLIEIKKAIKSLFDIKLDFICIHDYNTSSLQKTKEPISVPTKNIESVSIFLEALHQLLLANSQGLLFLTSMGHLLPFCTVYLAMMSRFLAVVTKLQSSLKTLLELLQLPTDKPISTPKTEPNLRTPPPVKIASTKITTPKTPTASKTPIVHAKAQLAVSPKTPVTTTPKAVHSTPVKTTTPLQAKKPTVATPIEKKNPIEQVEKKRKANEKDAGSIFDMLLMKKNKKS